MARCSGARISPMAAFLGGIIGQEVLKGCSGKFNPIEQFYYFDARQVLADDPAHTQHTHNIYTTRACAVQVLPSPNLDWAAEFAPRGTRYDAQIAVLGQTVHSKARARITHTHSAIATPITPTGHCSR